MARLRTAAVGLVIVILPLIFFWKLVFTNLILVGIDSFLYFYPYKAYVAQALLSGRFPLWNPHLFMGAPLFANMQTAVLYPLHWPFLWLTAPKQVAASIVLHVILAGLGMLLYVRRSLRLNRAGALAAAVVFALGGFVGAQVEHINQLNVIAWLPWAFLLLDMAGRGTRRVVSKLGLGLVIALMLLAGHAQATYICLAGVGVYAVAGGWGQERGKSQIGESANQRISKHLHCAQAQVSANQQRGKWADRQIAGGNTRRLVPAGWGVYLVSRVPYISVFLVAIVMATLLAAVQLLPTFELARLSVRAGGLPYREVVAFSLRPWQLHYSLLPPFGVDLGQVFGEAYSEYVAYVGLVGLGLAALGLLRRWRWAGARFAALLAVLGLFLGTGGFNPFYYILYIIIPGFDLFRAPARWMLLYAFGVAILAGIGMQEISGFKWANQQISESANQRISESANTCTARRRKCQRISRWAGGQISNLLSLVLLALLCLELFVASRGLRYNQPTAPEAFTFLRPSIAHLKTDVGLHRFLSLSGIVYDPGDLAEIYDIFSDQLPEKAIYDYVVAAKEKEVLFYNLPLLYGLNSVDGYDGGLLPLRDFVSIQRLFLDEEHLSLDGRLRENLRDVPPGRLLSLLGVKYVITDKVYDVWVDGLFYDLQFSARLSPDGVAEVSAADLPDFPATALGVISYLDGAADLADGTPVARIRVGDETGWSETFDLLAGRDSSEGRYGDGVAHQQAQVANTWRDDPSGMNYVTLVPLGGPRRLATVSIEGLAPAGEFVLRGLSLVDMRTTTTRQVTLSTDGHYRLVHSGDVKIYENLDVLPRALVVHQAEVIPDSDQTIARLRDPTFDPAQTLILTAGEPLNGSGIATVQIVDYAPEKISLVATSDAPGYLLLTDTFYPGWRASVDGQPVEILRADLAFRAVRLERGTHRVEFWYWPASVRWGVWISTAALLLWVAALVWGFLRRRAEG
ncbi:MAG: hypothetical protein Kow0063_27600 [Anaerolineae bacterium]